MIPPIIQQLAGGWSLNYFNPDCLPFGCPVPYPGFTEDTGTTDIGRIEFYNLRIISHKLCDITYYMVLYY